MEEIKKIKLEDYLSLEDWVVDTASGDYVTRDEIWSVLEKVYKLGEENENKRIISWLKNNLHDCAGCTYDKDEGTHSATTAQHIGEFLDKAKDIK